MIRYETNRLSMKGRPVLRFVFLVIVVISVLCDFSGLKRVVAGYLPLHQVSEEIAQTETSVTSQSQTPGIKQEVDIVVTDKDVERAYKELLKEQKEEVEEVKTLKADKGSFYRVKLASGRSLRAVQIQSTGNTVIITDSKGMIISLAKQEIADIEKVAN